METQQAAMEYKRAVNLQKAARDMVKVAEERVMTAEDKLDPTWQEMLNQANVKVIDVDHTFRIELMILIEKSNFS